MELSKKAGLRLKGERAHCLLAPVGKHTTVPGETTLPEKSFPCCKLGEIFLAGASLESFSCIVCPWGFFFHFLTLGRAAVRSCNINHYLVFIFM